MCYSINEGTSLRHASTLRIPISESPPIIANGIPIEGWINDPHDEALLDLLPVLDSLRFTNDVRRVLGIRGFLS